MKARKFDKKFGEYQEDILADLDLSTTRRPNQECLLTVSNTVL